MTLEIITDNLLLLFGNYYCYNLENITIQLVVVVVVIIIIDRGSHLPQAASNLWR